MVSEFLSISIRIHIYVMLNSPHARVSVCVKRHTTDIHPHVYVCMYVCIFFDVFMQCGGNVAVAVLVLVQQRLWQKGCKVISVMVRAQYNRYASVK